MSHHDEDAEHSGNGESRQCNPVTLTDCPPGFFLFKGEIHLKTEYGTEAPQGSQHWWPEAYCGSTGEYFWGGTSTHEERANLMVLPLDAADLARSNDDAKRIAAFQEMHKAELLRRHDYYVRAYLKLAMDDENRVLEYGRHRVLKARWTFLVLSSSQYT